MTITKTNFWLITCAIGVNGLFAAAAETPQESFLNSLYTLPVDYATTQAAMAKLPGITPADTTVATQSWMCLPAGFDTSSVVLTTLPDALRSQVDVIANAGSFLALKLQGSGDNPVETTASLAALKEGITAETDPIKKAVLERAHAFVQLIHDIDTALQAHIDAQEPEQVNRAVDSAVKNIIKLVGESNLTNLNVTSSAELSTRIKTIITQIKSNKPHRKARK